MVAPAGPRVREHDPGRVGDPDWLLRGHGHRGGGRWPDRRSGPLAAAHVRDPGTCPRRGGPGDAHLVPAHPRGLSRDLSDTRGRAPAPRDRPPGPCGARAGPRDDPHGRDVPEPDPPSRAVERAQSRIRTAVCGEHTRRHRRDARRRPGPHRGLRTVDGARDRGGLLRDRRRGGPGAVPPRRSPGPGLGPCRPVRARRNRRNCPARRKHGLRPRGDPGPRAARTAHLVHLRADVARLPGDVDATAGVGHGQHDVCVHRDPRGLPHRDRDRCVDLQCHPPAPARPPAAAGHHPDRGGGAGPHRAGGRHRTARATQPWGPDPDAPGAVRQRAARRAARHHRPRHRVPDRVGAAARRGIGRGLGDGVAPRLEHARARSPAACSSRSS